MAFLYRCTVSLSLAFFPKQLLPLGMGLLLLRVCSFILFPFISLHYSLILSRLFIFRVSLLPVSYFLSSSTVLLILSPSQCPFLSFHSFLKVTSASYSSSVSFKCSSFPRLFFFLNNFCLSVWSYCFFVSVHLFCFPLFLFTAAPSYHASLSFQCFSFRCLIFCHPGRYYCFLLHYFSVVSSLFLLIYHNRRISSSFLSERYSVTFSLSSF